MPGLRVTAERKRRFFYLTTDPDGPGLSSAAAAKELGFSETTAWRLRSGARRNFTEDTKDRQGDLPEPKTWAELSTDAQTALKDINVHSELFFARRPSPWRYETAMRVVDAIASGRDGGDRTYADLNVPPGFGKTTFGHDLFAWLIAGGGLLDPAFGRALRLMYGSETMKVSTHMILRLRRSLELRRPFWDKEQARHATHVMAREYGRFKPDISLGEESMWASDQILVAQMGDVDLYEKEPTVQAASKESGFLGERVNCAWWDDIATTRNSRNPDIAEDVSRWFEDEAETRLEPGGVLLLVGQRLGPLDLHRKRLDSRYTDEDGEQKPKYTDHIVFPAHQQHLCDGKHRQWDGHEDGCLTDAWRMKWRDIQKASSNPNFETVYQQRDINPATVLVQQVWIDGGEDFDGFPAPGCYDRGRGFFEHPKGVGRLVDYVLVDPSVTNWWALEWWAAQLDPADDQMRFRYLVYGLRKRMRWGDLLDWDSSEGKFTGIMNQLQEASIAGGHPIRVWVVEQVSAFKGLFQFDHYRRWRLRFPDVVVIGHETQKNKADTESGVQALMPTPYRLGLKRLPRKEGDLDALNYLRPKIKELTTFPHVETFDTVMADWFGEHNLPRILSLGRRDIRGDLHMDVKLPGYLKRQLRTEYYGEEER